MAIVKSKTPRAAWWLIGALVFTGAVVTIFGSGGGAGSTSAPPPAQVAPPLAAPTANKAAVPKNDAAAAAIAGARQLRASAKDPETFELKSAVVRPDGTACYVFRAKNSFNAMLESSAVLLPGKKPTLLVEGHHDGFVAAWNKRCTVAGGENVMPLIDRLGLTD